MKITLLKIIPITLVVLGILDKDYVNPSILDVIKLILIITCFCLVFLLERKEKHE